MSKVLTKSVTGIIVLVAILGFASSAFAVTPVYCSSGFSVIIDGKTYKGNQTIKLRNITNKQISIIGMYNEFMLNVDNFSVRNYTLTGLANAGDITGGQRTVVFLEKTPQLPSALNGELEIRLDGEHVRLLRDGAVKMKIQAKDCSQGGIFQQEADSSTVFKNVMGEGFSYISQSDGGEYAGKVFFSNGAASGYDSPENATSMSFGGNTAYWNVAAGGRIGMVIGEDGVEGGAPTTPTNPGEVEAD